MTDTFERKKCSCGLPMIPTSKGISFCENCDRVQPQEPYGIRRRKTLNDIRYETTWVRRMTEIFGKKRGESDDE